MGQVNGVENKRIKRNIANPISVNMSLFEPKEDDNKEKSTLKGSIYDDYLRIKRNIKFLLSVRKGEIPYRPFYGTRIYDAVLFENHRNIEDIKSTLFRIIKEDISDNTNEVEVLRIDSILEDSNLDKNIASFDLVLRHIKNNDIINVTLNLITGPVIDIEDTEGTKTYEVNTL